MADDANEDSWLYGTSNPDSTTNEIGNGDDALAAEHEAQALAAVVAGDKPGSSTASLLPGFPKEEVPEYNEFDDPAEEMEEDEEALPDTTDHHARGRDKAREETRTPPDQDEDEEMDEAPSRKERNGSGSDEDDDDDSDDDINVVIGDIKQAPSTFNIKQRPNLLAGTAADKAKPAGQAGKFSIEDFEGAGTINGVAVHEFSIDSLEEKPWRKPGADITDYFNYGFNEETWRAYCERQKRFRVAESGVGLASLTQNVSQNAPIGILNDGGMNMGPPGMHNMPPMMGMNDIGMQMPPPGMPPPNMMQHQPRPGMGMMQRPPRPISTTGGGVKENAIQVMTAECREYSRGGLGPMAPNFPPPGASDEPFFHEPEPFDYGYEPTQESQWGNDNPGWVPTGIKELTPGHAHIHQPPPGMPPQMNVPPPQMGGPPPQLRGMMPPNMRMPMNMGPPHGMMMGPGNGPPPGMRMGMAPPQQRMPMGGNNNGNISNLPASSSASSSSDRGGYDDERERRRREKDKQIKKDALRKDFLEMLRERHDIERHTRWYDIKKKFESDPRYRALDSAYREEYFEDYLHMLKDEKRKERDVKERDRHRDKERSRDKDKEKDTKDKDKDKEKEDRKDSSSRVRSRSRDKSSRRKSKSREKERSERSSKTSGGGGGGGSSSAAASGSSSSSRGDKKKSHRKDKEEEE